MKTWQSSTSPAPASPNSEIILKPCPPQYFSPYCHSLRLFFKRRQEQTSPTMHKQQNLRLDYSSNIPWPTTVHVLLHLCTLLREAALAVTEKALKSSDSSWQYQFVIPECAKHVRSPRWLWSEPKQAQSMSALQSIPWQNECGSSLHAWPILEMLAAVFTSNSR